MNKNCGAKYFLLFLERGVKQGKKKRQGHFRLGKSQMLEDRRGCYTTTVTWRVIIIITLTANSVKEK